MLCTSESSQASTFGRDGRASPAASVQSAETALDSVAFSACIDRTKRNWSQWAKETMRFLFLTQFHEHIWFAHGFSFLYLGSAGQELPLPKSLKHSFRLSGILLPGWEQMQLLVGSHSSDRCGVLRESREDSFLLQAIGLDHARVPTNRLKLLGDHRTGRCREKQWSHGGQRTVTVLLLVTHGDTDFALLTLIPPNMWTRLKAF